MIPIPDLDFLHTQTARQKNLAEAFDIVTRAIRSTLAHHAEVYTRRKHDFIAWKCRSQLCFVWLITYNSFTFRLKSTYDASQSLTAKFWPPVKAARTYWNSPESAALREHYQFELSFIAADLPLVASPDLVRFVNSTFEPGVNHESIWRWPIFAHDESYPEYAWTVQAETEYERRRKINESKEQRLAVLRSLSGQPM